MFTADSLANVHEYDAREFGTKSHEKALLLGLDILRNYRTEGVDKQLMTLADGVPEDQK